MATMGNVEELRARVTEADGDADALIAVLEDAFAALLRRDGDDASLDAIEHDLLRDISPESTGEMIRQAAAADRERGREVYNAYMSIVYLVSSDGGQRESVMRKPDAYDEMLEKAAA